MWNRPQILTEWNGTEKYFKKIKHLDPETKTELK